MEKWEKLKELNEKQIKDMQFKQMQTFFSQEIIKRHPYYSEVFKEKSFNIEGVSSLSLQELPFTTLEDLAQRDNKKDRIKRFQLSPPAKDEAKIEPKKKSFFGKLLKGSSSHDSVDPQDYHMSQLLYSGDFSSPPVPLVFTTYDIERLKESGRRLFDLWGLTRDDTMINAFSYAPHLGFWQVFYAGLEKGSTVLQSGGGRILGTEKILTAMENMKAEVLFASPLYAKNLLQAAIKFNADLSNLTTIILGMEPVSKEMVARIKELMEMASTAGNRVLRSFYLTEAKTGWGECEGGEGFHTHPDLQYVEIIDPYTGKVLGEKEPGEVVLTHLDARGTCLIRYKTGIRTTGGISYEPCPGCGSSLPRLTGELEELKYIVKLSSEDNDAQELNLEEITRRLDQEKALLLWQGSVNTEDENSSKITITSSWFNKDDSPALNLAEEIKKKTGLEVEFIQESYGNVINQLKLETGFTSKRWLIK